MNDHEWRAAGCPTGIAYQLVEMGLSKDGREAISALLQRIDTMQTQIDELMRVHKGDPLRTRSSAHVTDLTGQTQPRVD